MALETTFDVAEIDDLGFWVAAGAPRPLVVGRATESSRLLKTWAAALAAVAVLGFAGHFFERRPLEPAASDPVIVVQRPPPAAGGPRFPAFGHSGFRYQDGAVTKVSLRLTRVPGHDGSIARLDVSGRVDGPIGDIAAKLVSGSVTLDEVTRYFAAKGGVAPGPYGAFDVSFAMPSDAELSDLWVVVRAYVGERLAAVESIAVDPTWPQLGPDKYVIDDVVSLGPHADPLGPVRPVLRMPESGRPIAR